MQATEYDVFKIPDVWDIILAGVEDEKDLSRLLETSKTLHGYAQKQLFSKTSTKAQQYQLTQYNPH